MIISSTLKFLQEELNKFLSVKIGPSTTGIRVITGNASKILDDTSFSKNVIVSLINIEEDKFAKQQENYKKSNTTVIYKNPPLYLNLYVLFVVKMDKQDDFNDCLIWLGYIIQFFQNQNVFTPISNPNLDPGIQKLIVELYSMNFEQINHLWSILGGKYFPSVLYKVRQITIDEDAEISESGFITTIQLGGKNKQTIS